MLSHRLKSMCILALSFVGKPHDYMLFSLPFVPESL